MKIYQRREEQAFLVTVALTCMTRDIGLELLLGVGEGRAWELDLLSTQESHP
jgi:hypothetical protein